MDDILRKKFEAVLYDMVDSEQWENWDDIAKDAVEWVGEWHTYLIESYEEAKREARS